ncbi:MBOAT family O-acyltransferase [Marivirga arenosa]|uniref:MBOAT family O-acyltransferase n=1 Tax=Marivirga arenosa TaxID=3059076 RepID=A0AA51N8N4_9BACT|nr:MBOAT family O-acyltransferase [Marivirga sp. ABR2-2]WMN08053.1 MBOAT family O-acyltransferase [Marivirga sp. ABR2-2]
MLFNSLGFLLFFPIVVIIYFILPNKWRWVWLLAASYYFYMSWNATYALLILTSTVITYLSGIFINKSDKVNKKKVWVAISFVSNLLILIYFKYFNFLANSINDLMEISQLGINIPNLDILLPVGISFYTFQALSYTVDVYRDQIKPELHFGKYALFVSFFPQLVAGPIERSSHLIPQFSQRHPFNYNKFKSGLRLMIWGFFMKLVVADRVAILVNEVYNSPEDHYGVQILVATVFFAIQIYCDFAGYSNIAIGAARIMGFDLMKNFDTPYFSKSITEFWRRWHISLSTWFRDYLYIPLGGSRVKLYRSYLNLFIVFLVSGLWHGASYNFLIWGALHGIFIVVEKAINTSALRPTINRFFNFDLLANKLLLIVFTFILADFAWIFFRANNLSDSVVIIRNLFDWDWNLLFNGSLYNLGLEANEFWLAVYSILFLIGLEVFQSKMNLSKALNAQPIIFRWSVYLILLFSVLIFGVYGSEEKSFIYFQF